MKFSLYFIVTLLAFCISTSLFATDYVFIGNGDWNDPNNWQDGIVPIFNPPGNTISIKGTAIVGTPYDQCPLVLINGVYETDCTQTLDGNGGTITIETGGSLTLQNAYQFSSSSSIIIYGTLINNTWFEGFESQHITIYGTLINKNVMGNDGSVIVKSGGTFINDANSGFSNNGEFIAESGAAIYNSSYLNLESATISNGAVINNDGTLDGSPTINGSVNNSGTLAPGHSPGIYTINGDYTAISTAKHNFEVSGTAEGTYDALNVSGNINLSGTLNVSVIDGYIPTTSDNIPIITGTIKGTFSTINIPSQYELVYNNNSVVLQSVSILPVNFVSIIAQKEGNGVKLTWNVADEYNVTKYEVEKSTNGSAFTRIGAVNAAHKNRYDFIDDQPETKNYYRVKSIDLDGKFKYSPITSYSVGYAIVMLNIYPSPVKNEMIVQHTTATSYSKITIIAMDGKVVKSILPIPGSHQTRVNVTGLMAGMYILRFESSGKVESIKFSKQQL